MKIYLVGMPGSGKSTLGKKLARELLLQFVDLDAEIEKHSGKSIPEIFLQNGEDHFRRTESALLHQWASGQQDFIMATGGGTPCFYNGIDVINNSGFSIFLDVPLKDLLTRVGAKTNRPLLANAEEREKTLLKLLETRLPFYKQAKVTLSHPTLDRALEAIHFKK
jgi:shikimate kinase